MTLQYQTMTLHMQQLKGKVADKVNWKIFPEYHPDKEDPLHYLGTFEKIGQDNEILEMQYGAILHSSINHTVLGKILAKLPTEVANDYPVFKQYVREWLALTPEITRQKIRDAKMLLGEPFTEFEVRLAELLQVW